MSDYILVNNRDKLKRSIRELNRAKPGDVFAVDCEGVNLSREGELTVVTVATTEDKVYIFDVAALEHDVFDYGLREILEDSTREKLMFDCREDSDALWHQYRVKLSGVLDVQLLEVMYRRRRPSTRVNRAGSVDFIRGFGQCLKIYVKNNAAIKTKDIGKHLMQKDDQVWRRRPMSGALLRYCAVDTLQIFDLYNHLMESWKQSRENLPGLRIASERYADMHRNKAVRSFDEYEMNAFLPAEIIPPKGVVYSTCEGCQRSIPKRDFPHQTQKCSVCRKIDQRKPKKDKKYEEVACGDKDGGYDAPGRYTRGYREGHATGFGSSQGACGGGYYSYTPDKGGGNFGRYGGGGYGSNWDVHRVRDSSDSDDDSDSADDSVSDDDSDCEDNDDDDYCYDDNDSDDYY